MENGESLFLKIIGKLNAGDVLRDIVLIGSWVLKMNGLPKEAFVNMFTRT
ncbi:MAG: hypothetical protein ACQEQU_01545 [Spirochaetota bacterium]